MNEESGFGVAQEIRRMRLNTEIAIVTSYGEARNDAFQYRPIGYVDKPATIEEVTRLLRLYYRFLFRLQALHLCRKSKRGTQNCGQ